MTDTARTNTGQRLRCEATRLRSSFSKGTEGKNSQHRKRTKPPKKNPRKKG